MTDPSPPPAPAPAGSAQAQAQAQARMQRQFGQQRQQVMAQQHHQQQQQQQVVQQQQQQSSQQQRQAAQQAAAFVAAQMAAAANSTSSAGGGGGAGVQMAAGSSPPPPMQMNLQMMPGGYPMFPGQLSPAAGAMSPRRQQQQQQQRRQQSQSRPAGSAPGQQQPMMMMPPPPAMMGQASGSGGSGNSMRINPGMNSNANMNVGGMASPQGSPQQQYQAMLAQMQMQQQSQQQGMARQQQRPMVPSNNMSPPLPLPTMPNMQQQQQQQQRASSGIIPPSQLALEQAKANQQRQLEVLQAQRQAAQSHAQARQLAQAQLALAASAAAAQKQRQEERGGAAPAMPSQSSSPPADGHQSVAKKGSGTSKQHTSSRGRGAAGGSRQRNTASSPLDHSDPEIMDLLARCPWEDRLIYTTRLFLGGNSLNGYLKATSAAQRYKRQRARQVQNATNKKKEEMAAEEAMARGTAAGGKAGSDSATDAEGSVVSGLSGLLGAGSTDGAPAASQLKAKKATNANADPEEEERLKHETMNGRLAKKIRQDMLAGKEFCDNLTFVLQGILTDLDSTIAQEEAAKAAANKAAPSSTKADKEAKRKAKEAKAKAKAAAAEAKAKPPAAAKPKIPEDLNAETVADGNPKGSTLRKVRKRPKDKIQKMALSKEDEDLMNPFDKSGKRTLSKKEVGYRSFNITRFRSLRAGDYVAARMASHDLWILARVAKDWDALDVSHSELLNMSEAKRETLFSNQMVHIQDIEEYDGDAAKAKPVARHLVLPLPRTFDEAEDWCARCRKGTRVYAMYPSTTSLYCATAVDNTTFCRGDDDIVVVEFDGDEDDNHHLPQRHIPARFITLIPQEFPAAKVKIKKKVASKKAGSGRASPANKRRAASPATKKRTATASGAASVASAASSGMDESLIEAMTTENFMELGTGSFSEMDDIFGSSSNPVKHVTVASSYADIIAQKNAQAEAKSSGAKSAKGKKRGASKEGAAKKSKNKKAKK